MYTFKPITINDLVINNVIKNVKNNSNIIKSYNFMTKETYRMKRLTKRDIFNDNILNQHECFEYIKVWNPYTGNIIDKDDEFGPLCFDGYELSYYYYINRLNGLWNVALDGYDSYYGELLGTGKEINIASRGSYPEKYLLRLPIIDCYVYEDSSHSVVTMGPIISDDEIDRLDNILCYCRDTLDKKFTENEKLMKTLKYNYDEALNSNPNPTCELIENIIEKYPDLNQKNINEKYNRHHVEILKNL
jgi:hypothetical protein